MRKIILILIAIITVSGILAWKGGQGTIGKYNTNIASDIPTELIQSGDLIFRDGRGIISKTFKSFSIKDPRFSHVGFIHKESGCVFVYHIIGDAQNKNDNMRKELLSNFISPLQANAFAIYRSNLNPKKIDSLSGVLFNKKIQFDSSFDLKTDDKMYCTEFVYKVLSIVSGQNNFIPLNTVSGKEFVACDNIYLSSNMENIYSRNYEN
jgi:hypothetical protein